jgi:hypothetical protein
MNVTIAREIEAQAQKRAKAEGLTIEAYLERLIREDAAWNENTEAALDEQDPDYSIIRAAVEEGFAQAERGEGKPARDVFAELRATHDVSR